MSREADALDFVVLGITSVIAACLLYTIIVFPLHVVNVMQVGVVVRFVGQFIWVMSFMLAVLWAIGKVVGALLL